MKTILQDIAISPLALILPRVRALLCISLLVRGMSASFAQGSMLVVPSGLENTFGDTAAGPIFTPSAQQIYGASLFSGLPSSVIQITGIAFRVDEFDSAPSLDVVIPNAILLLGVFRGDISAVPRNGFAADVRTTTVFSAENLHLVGKPGKAFDLKFTFDTPFTYDRNEGQLVLTMNLSSSPAINVRNLDAQSAPDAVYLRAEPLGRVGAADIVLATAFSYVSVPEPSSLAVLIIGLIICAIFLRRKESSEPR